MIFEESLLDHRKHDPSCVINMALVSKNSCMLFLQRDFDL